MKLKTLAKDAIRTYFLFDLYDWIVKVKRIIKNYDEINIDNNVRIDYAINKSKEAVSIIKERTNIHADVSFNPHSPNQVIVIGRYHKSEYINVFNIEEQDMEHIIYTLKKMQEYGKVRHIDAPLGSASFMRDLI